MDKRKDDHLTVRVGRRLKTDLQRDARASHRSLGAQIRLILERVSALSESARRELLDGEVRA